MDEVGAAFLRTRSGRCRVYLDSQQWNYLVERPLGDLGVPLALLRRAISAGLIELVSSVDVIHELVLARASQRPKSDRMLQLHTELVGRRLLRPLDDRLCLEVACGGLLSERQRFVPGHFRDAISRTLDDDRQTPSILDRLNEERDQFKVAELMKRTSVVAELRDSQVPVSRTPLRMWLDAVDVADWVRTVVELGVQLNLYKSPNRPEYSFRWFPSAWMFVSARLARIALIIGEGRKIKPSDLADMLHVSYGAYYDLLVTDDVQLTEMVGMVRGLPIAVMSSIEFRSALAASLRCSTDG